MIEDNDATLDDLPSELEQLKHRADVLGISYHPNIGLEKLRAKVQAKLDTDEQDDAEQAANEKETKPVVNPAIAAKEKALQLVRIRVTCMDPSKKEYEGEIFSAGNSLIGTVKKYVPFETEWHVPRILLNVIKDKHYQTFVTIKNPDGSKRKEGKRVRTYAVEELPPLTPAELKALKQRQLMANNHQD